MDYKDLKDGLNVMVYIPAFPNQFFRGKVSTYGSDGGFYIEITRKIEGHEIYGVVYPDTIDNWYYMTPVKEFSDKTDYEKGREHFLKNGKVFFYFIKNVDERHLYLLKQKTFTYNSENRQ